MDGTSEDVDHEASTGSDDATTATVESPTGDDDEIPTDIDAEHTRDLDGEPADTTPVSDIDLGVEDMELPDDDPAGDAGTANADETADKSTATTDESSQGLIGKLKSFLFG